MFRPPEGPDFDQHSEEKPLALLVRLLAAALGRAEALRLERERDKRLLRFGSSVANATSESGVAEALAQLVHETVNDSVDEQAEVTVRLVNFGTGGIERRAHCGMETKNTEIFLWDDDSMIQRVVKQAIAERDGDIQTPKGMQRSRDTGLIAGRLHSEMCIPLLSGPGAMGAVNAEHVLVNRYRDEDEEFVKSAAALASAAFERLRATSFLSDVTRFASDFANSPAQKLRTELQGILQRFSGASAIVRLKALPHASAIEAWPIEHVSVEIRGGDEEQLAQNLRSLYRDSWQQTTLYELIARQAWTESACQFRADSNVAVRLRGYEVVDRATGTPGIERAIAVIWLRKSPQTMPYACLLLLWFFRPWMSAQDVDRLADLAHLLSALEDREESLRTWMKTAILREQAAALGHLLQHFRHRLRADIGALKGLADRMSVAAETLPAGPMLEYVQELQQCIEVLGRRFKKSIGYIKEPKADLCQIQVLNQQVVAHMADSLAGVDVRDLTPLDLLGNADTDIYELALYTLIENSVEAMQNLDNASMVISATRGADGAVVVAVSDSGPGVSLSMASRLFEFGATSKSEGLGSALAFARLRLRLFGADLRHAPLLRPLGGATFEVCLPRHGAKVSDTDHGGLFGSTL